MRLLPYSALITQLMVAITRNRSSWRSRDRNHDSYAIVRGTLDNPQGICMQRSIQWVVHRSLGEVDGLGKTEAVPYWDTVSRPLRAVRYFGWLVHRLAALCVLAARQYVVQHLFFWFFRSMRVGSSAFASSACDFIARQRGRACCRRDDDVDDDGC